MPNAEPGMSPHGNLVQRGAGALRAGGLRAGAGAVRGHRAARALSVCGGRPAHRGWRAARCAMRIRQQSRSTCPSTCCWASCRRMRRDVATRRPATGAALDGGRSAGGGTARAVASGGGGQDLPDHDRRSHGRRPDQPRPDGRALAGAGGGCRGDAERTIAATAARRWRWASARRWRCWIPPLRRAWR